MGDPGRGWSRIKDGLVKAPSECTRCLYDVEILYLVQEKGEKEVSDVVGPAKEELVNVFLKDLIDQSASLLDWQVVQGPVKEMQGPWDGH